MRIMMFLLRNHGVHACMRVVCMLGVCSGRAHYFHTNPALAIGLSWDWSNTPKVKFFHGLNSLLLDTDHLASSLEWRSPFKQTVALSGEA